MSRLDGKFEAAGDGAIDRDELFRLLADPALDPPARARAVACYLAADDGWRRAERQLGGAFAGLDGDGTGDGRAE